MPQTLRRQSPLSAPLYLPIRNRAAGLNAREDPPRPDGASALSHPPSAAWLIQMPLANDVVFSGLRIQLVDVEVRADVKAGMVDRKIQRR